ncbi:metallophosphoesterase family protein [Nitrospirillum iridis]|uniref:Serine/threonine protein phosphatase 1 n=1 Tax=Nitrospirillum iridis TaxID=765888 RepID=A0A7X0B1L7_9PROT|nr:metallophosphoesterase family protein [Nitrospirillum iridis]MBB6253697.1 serine/threonine protein phosphatase 1 [Nitrospirillum iridis]
MWRRFQAAWVARRAAVDSRAPAPTGGTSRAPEGQILYAIGDIHGEVGLLRSLLSEIVTDWALHGRAAGVTPILVYIGDYIDRGPDSRGVIDLLLSNPLPEFRSHWLLGNHEAALLDFLQDPVGGAAWLDFGGLATLLSYGVRPLFSGSAAERARALRDDLAARLPPEHLAFLGSLERMVVYGDYAFVHAGVRPGRALADQALEDMLWIRAPFLESPRRHEKTVVHGHTIVPAVDRRPNRIAIDTGAYTSGLLSAIALQGGDVRVLTARRAVGGAKTADELPSAVI